jgi:hypothetical protein
VGENDIENDNADDGITLGESTLNYSHPIA